VRGTKEEFDPAYMDHTTWLTMDSLRRACATHMLLRCASPVEIQHLLGHASMRHLSAYLRLTITELREVHAKSRLGK